MTPRLSPRAVEVYEFIVSFKKKHDGNSPTIRDICKGCQINSTSVVHTYLNMLAVARLIELESREQGNRIIRVVGGYWQPPLLKDAVKARKVLAGVTGRITTH